MSTNLQYAVGQKLSIKTKHDIELEKTFDLGDEMIGNIYFNYKENELLIPASETNIMNTSENDSDVSAVLAKGFNFSEKVSVFFNEQTCNLPVLSFSDNLPTLATISSDKTVLNQSDTIPKENKLSTIVEETFGSVQNLGYNDSPSCSFRHSSFVDEKSEFMNQSCNENFDSDDSLGILPFDKFCSFDVNPYLEINQPQLNKTFGPISSNKDEECVFLQDNHDFPEGCYPTLDSVIFDKSGAVTNNFHPCEENLNTAMILSNSLAESRRGERKVIPVEAPSPECIISNVSSFTKNDSPICNIAVSPNVYASTPKHETNYSYVLEDDALCLAPNSSVDQLNKTISKKGAAKCKRLTFMQHKPDPIYTSPIKTAPADKNEVLEENILNVTCDLPKSLDINESHNKVFNNLNETCILSFAESNNEPNMNNKLDIHAQSTNAKDTKCQPLHKSPKDYLAVKSEFYLCAEQEMFENQIILNRTHDLVKVLDSNTKKLENQNIESILNTTISLPEKLEDVNCHENVIMVDETVALNTTFEKLEKPNLQASVNPLNSSKQCAIKYNNNTKQIASKSKSQKTVQFVKSGSLKVGCRNEGTAFDRKSVGCFDKTEIFGTLHKRSQRKSVGCFNTDDSNGASNKLSRNRNSFISNSCISSDNEDRMSAKTTNKAISNQKSKENQNVYNVARDLHCKTVSKSSDRYERNSCLEIQFESRLESVLNETPKLPTSMPNIGKTVVKKSKAVSTFYKSSSEMSKLTKYKIESKTKIPFSEKGHSTKILTSSENKLAQKCKNTLLNKPNQKSSFVRTVYQVEKHMETRPSEKCVLSQKNISSCISSNADNLCRPRRTTSGVKFDPSSAFHVPFKSRIPSISQYSIKQKTLEQTQVSHLEKNVLSREAKVHDNMI